MKVRVIPTILTDGSLVVKGKKFENSRVVGSTEAVARLYGNRNVDELLFLDVNSRARKSVISDEILSFFVQTLDIPFSVGGGIDNLQQARNCFRKGAEKIIIGTSAVENPNLIKEIADTFGSQAVVVSIDIGSNLNEIYTHSGKILHKVNAIEFVKRLELLGAGEILLQSVPRDGLMKGFDLVAIEQISKSVNIPVIASSGCGILQDFLDAVHVGASAVAAGAFFHFTDNTPSSVRNFLKNNSVDVRTIS